MFEIPPLQRQGVNSAQAQYCHCHTRNFPNKATTLSKPHNLHLGFWSLLHIALEELPICSNSVATHTYAQSVRGTACKFQHLHCWLPESKYHQHTSVRWFLLFGLGPFLKGRRPQHLEWAMSWRSKTERGIKDNLEKCQSTGDAGQKLRLHLAPWSAFHCKCHGPLNRNDKEYRNATLHWPNLQEKLNQKPWPSPRPREASFRFSGPMHFSLSALQWRVHPHSRNQNENQIV